MDTNDTECPLSESVNESHICINDNRAIVLDFKGKCYAQYGVDLLKEVGYTTESFMLNHVDSLTENVKYTSRKDSSLEIGKVNWFDDDFDEDKLYPNDLPFNVNVENNLNEETDAQVSCFRSKTNSISALTQNVILNENEPSAHKTSCLEKDVEKTGAVNVIHSLNTNQTVNNLSLSRKEHIVLIDSHSTFHTDHEVDLLKEAGYDENLGMLKAKNKEQTMEMEETSDQNEPLNASFTKLVQIDDVDVEVPQNDLDGPKIKTEESEDMKLLNNFYVMDGGLPFKVVDGQSSNQLVHNVKKTYDQNMKTVEETSVPSSRNRLSEQCESEHSSTSATQQCSQENTDDALCRSHFHLLPYELTRKIFSYLALKELCLSAGLVCRKWNDYANDPSHWTKLIIGPDLQISSYRLAKLIIKSPRLRYLSLHGKFDLAADELLYISKSCPQLRILDLGFIVTIDPEGILNIANNCVLLQSLNVEGCILVDNLCISYICKEGCLQHLTSLNLSHCTNINDVGLNLLAEHKERLSSLNIDGIPWISDSALEDLCSKRGAVLRQLWLDGAEISDVGVQSVAQHCPELTLLSFSFAELLTDASLQSIKMLHCLTSLTLRKGADFSADTLRLLFTGKPFPNLQKLDLSECVQIDDNVLEALTDSCEGTLTHMTLCWCWHVLDPGLEHIVNTCRNLKSLDLTGLDKIEGDCLINIPVKLPNLVFLDLKQCNKIEDDVIVEVLKQVSAEKLTVIDYYGNKFEQNM